MNLTTQQLETVEKLANRTIPANLIASVIEVDELEFMDDIHTPGTDARKFYLKGVVQRMVDTREAIIKAATNGSNPAQAELLTFLQHNILDLNA